MSWSPSFFIGADQKEWGFRERLRFCLSPVVTRASISQKKLLQVENKTVLQEFTEDTILVNEVDNQHVESYLLYGPTVSGAS